MILVECTNMRRLARPSRNVLWGFGALLAACTSLFYSPLQFIWAVLILTPDTPDELVAQNEKNLGLCFTKSQAS